MPPDAGSAFRQSVPGAGCLCGLAFSNWQLSFGRQSLWWGPGDGGPLIFSDNAAPLNMFRINRVSPFKLPSILGWLGPLRLEFFLGQLSGQQFINVNGPSGRTGSFLHTLHPQPMIHGERFTFKPTPNFEFGFSRTVLFAGEGLPFTLHTFETKLIQLQYDEFCQAASRIQATGDREWTGHIVVPKLRDWVTFYGDAFADDEISPIAYWDRSAIRAGLYFSHAAAASQSLICGSRASTPICRQAVRSVTAFSTSTPVFEWLYQPGAIARQLDRPARPGCSGMGQLLV